MKCIVIIRKYFDSAIYFHSQDLMQKNKQTINIQTELFVTQYSTQNYSKY